MEVKTGQFQLLVHCLVNSLYDMVRKDGFPLVALVAQLHLELEELEEFHLTAVRLSVDEAHKDAK